MNHNDNTYTFVTISIHTKAGTHLEGFVKFYEELNNYASKNNLIKNDKITLSGDDFGKD